jgi:hypothetical protein
MSRLIRTSFFLIVIVAMVPRICFAQTEIQQKCGDALSMMRYSLQGLRAENSVFSLKRNGQTYLELFVSKIDLSKNGEEKSVLFAPWRLIERQGQSLDYCMIAAGDWVESLTNVQAAHPRMKYGMPGSGFQRCSDGKDIQDAIDVRIWANKELGESFTLYLRSDIGENNFTFLMSNDKHWIIIDDNKNNVAISCFHSRGEDVAVYYDMNTTHLNK